MTTDVIDIHTHREEESRSVLSNCETPFRRRHFPSNFKGLV
jgi:hypothetical protein